MKRKSISRHFKTGFAAKAPTIVKGSQQILIERLAHDGRGIGRLNGKIAFIAGALAGELHQVDQLAERSKFYEGQSAALLGKPSSSRVAPDCEYFDRCGGCQLQHLNYPAQIEFKEATLVDQLRRSGVEITDGSLAPAIESAAWQYRHRCRLSIAHKEKPAFLGFRQLQSNNLIKIQHCAVLNSGLDRLIAPLQKVIAQLAAASLGHVELIDSSPKAFVIVRHLAFFTEFELALLDDFAQAQACVVLLQPKNEGLFFTLDGQPFNGQLSYSLNSLVQPLKFRPADFTQVNQAVNQKMVEQVLNWLQPSPQEVWLDLFCGIGNFSFALAQQVKSVVGVEANSDMIMQAELNLAQQSLKNCQFLVGDLEQSSIYQKLPKSVDGVLLDPPRAGAAGVLAHLNELNPMRLLYISCDPSTFARDAKVLTQLGYSLSRLGVLDMFPQTKHLETMALFEKN